MHLKPFRPRIGISRGGTSTRFLRNQCGYNSHMKQMSLGSQRVHKIRMKPLFKPVGCNCYGPLPKVHSWTPRINKSSYKFHNLRKPKFL